jgi:hypothetical protein
MSKAKRLMVYFLSLSIVIAFTITTTYALATADTSGPFEAGVSLGKPLPDATLKDATGMGVTIVVIQSSSSTGNYNQVSNSAIIKGINPPFNSSFTTPNNTSQTRTTSVTVPYWFTKKQ